MEVTRLGPVCGAEITGVDLGLLDGESFGAIRQAFVEHEVLVFPDQDIDTAQQIDFGRRFGDLLVHHFARIRTEGQPELMTILTDVDRPDPLTDIWHSDETYRAAPPMATILRSLTLPELGGDTMFASMTAAYEGLSSRMKDYVAGLTAVHGFGRFRHRFQRDPSQLPILHEIELANPNPSHPVVTVHPESGRRVLFVNWHFTTHVNELPEEESRMLLDFLRNRVLQPEYQLRVRWRPNMVVAWDNRSVQHYAPKDYFPQARKMERVTIAGEVPVAAEPGPPVELPRVTIGPAGQA
jgi:taurine dioxygenase